MARVCVFCGASAGNSPAFAESAKELARLLLERDDELIYGGGHVGLMGVLADTMLAAGGSVIGVIPQELRTRELAHSGLQELRVVDSMLERKRVMGELADGFIALPGGLGTLDELFEVVTWRQLGFTHKPCALFDPSDYYAGIHQFLDHAVGRGFVRAEDRDLLRTFTTLEQIAAWLQTLESARAMLNKPEQQ